MAVHKLSEAGFGELFYGPNLVACGLFVCSPKVKNSFYVLKCCKTNKQRANVKDCMWSTKPKVFIIWLLTGKVG